MMNPNTTVHTIGFTKKTASEFFALLRKSGTKRIIDVRLNNVSQLAGFSKRDDLRFSLKEICDIDYIHEALLAPTKDILDAYKKHKGDWDIYEPAFLELMKTREIEKRINPKIMQGGCLLCSEDKPHHCHRRLVVEYLNQHWGEMEIRHLV